MSGATRRSPNEREREARPQLAAVAAGLHQKHARRFRRVA